MHGVAVPISLAGSQLGKVRQVCAFFNSDDEELSPGAHESSIKHVSARFEPGSGGKCHFGAIQLPPAVTKPDCETGHATLENMNRKLNCEFASRTFETRQTGGESPTFRGLLDLPPEVQIPPGLAGDRPSRGPTSLRHRRLCRCRNRSGGREWDDGGSRWPRRHG